MSEQTDGLRIRRAVRALLVDPDGHVLLVRFEFPTAIVWALPGGGVEPGEPDHHALRRELREECGLDVDHIGPRVWRRLHIVPFLDGSFDGQEDHAHLIRTPRFEPEPEIGWAQLRAERVFEMRWWSRDELVRAPTTSTTRFAPSELPGLVSRIIDEGPPTEPFQVGA